MDIEQLENDAQDKNERFRILGMANASRDYEEGRKQSIEYRRAGNDAYNANAKLLAYRASHG